MKKYIYPFLMFAATLGACSSGDDTAATETEQTPVVVDYSSSTRMTGGLADDGDAFTFISYMTKDANGTERANPGLLSNNADYRGFYMYDTGGSLLVPVAVSATTYKPNPATRNNGYAQKLNAGTYRTVVMYPAVPLTYSVPELGFMARFKRLEDVYASYHDNVDVEDATPREFEMLVQDNLAVYDVPAGIKMYPTKSRITVHFFSSTGVNYQIPTGGLKLVWGGTEGWYNAYTGKTYPSYSSTAGVYAYDNATPTEDDVQNFKDSGLSTVTIPTGGPYTEMYRIEDEPVFAANYTGNDFYVKPLTLRVVLRMPLGGGTADMTSDLPIKLNMERGKTYEFYVDVKSGLFEIWYEVKGWVPENGDDGSQNIGEVMPYDKIYYDFSGSGDWEIENGGDGSDNIG